MGCSSCKGKDKKYQNVMTHKGRYTAQAAAEPGGTCLHADMQRGVVRDEQYLVGLLGTAE